MKLNEVKNLVKDSTQVNINNRLNKIDVSSYLKKETPSRSFLNLKVVYTFASLIILFIVAISINMINTPTTTLTFDINPSIEVKLNTFNKVVSVEAINQDGYAFIDALDYKNKSIDELLTEIQLVGTELGYFETSEAFMLVGVYADDYDAESKVVDILDSSIFFNCLTITQHYETDQLRLNDIDYDSYFETMFSRVESNESITQEGSADYQDTNSLDEPASPQIDYSGYSEVKLLIVQSLINETDYTQADLLTLLDLPISELITEYNTID